MAHQWKTVLALTLVAAPALAAVRVPVQNVDSSRHGNLAAAQALVRQAYDRVGIAQSDNDDKLGGHAMRAKDLLVQANDEIKLAADAADHH